MPDVSQTWDWEGAEAAVASCRSSLLVTEMFGAGRTPRERWRAMSGVVAQLTRVTHPVVLSWPQSQRVGDPAMFTEGDLDGLINVRYFSISNDPGATVMDTLGLHVFELPDVQCHFRGREPGEIAKMLFSTAAYLFRAGDVIADGNTISGPKGDERLVCFHEPALLEPSRQVIDVDLGDPIRGWTAGGQQSTRAERAIKPRARSVIPRSKRAAYRQQLELGTVGDQLARPH